MRGYCAARDPRRALLCCVRALVDAAQRGGDRDRRRRLREADGDRQARVAGAWARAAR
jgi:hypothetical protein